MLTNKRERARQQRAALWATRDNVQRHALSMSMPWLAFVNIAFALMIFFRNLIFTYFDKRLLTHRAVIPYIEAALIAVIIISAILVIIALTPRLAQGRYTLNIITGLLLALSLCWSLSNYCFIFFWTLPFAWPLLVILMTTGLTALYHHWPGITAFMLPLWVTALLAGIQLHYHTEIRFLILWAIFTAILLYGRRILQRWYDEAWDTHQENMQLIQDLVMNILQNRSISGILIICRECLWNSGVIIRPIGKENLILVYGQGVWDLDMIRLHLTIFCRERPSIGKMKRSD